MKKPVTHPTLLFVTLLVATFLPTLLGAQSLIDLGDLGGGYSWAVSINDSGQVVGTATANGQFHTFLYSGGHISDIGTLPGDQQTGAFQINNSGQVVGYSALSSGGGSRAIIYQNGSISDLGISPGSYGNIASGINNIGQIVGTTKTSYGGGAFLYSGGTVTDLGPYSANKINDAGQIVGYASGGTNAQAVLYANGAWANLGTLPGSSSSSATDINNRGQIVGRSGSNAFLYSNQYMQDLGNLSGFDYSNPEAINDAGQIVGEAYSSTSASSYHAFLYNNGALSDLNTLESSLLVSGGTNSAAGFVSLNYAEDINNKGQIVGLGTYWTGSNYEGQAFLLTVQSTPEPRGWALSVVGIGLLIWLRCRQRSLRFAGQPNSVAEHQ